MSSSANHRNHNGRRRNPNSTSVDRNRERAANKARREERLVNTNESRNRILFGGVGFGGGVHSSCDLYHSIYIRI